VYLFKGEHPPVFHPVAGPSANDLQRLVEQIAVGVGQALERRGLIEATSRTRGLLLISRPARWMI